MTHLPVKSRKNIDVFTRIIHLGLVVFGVLSLATGGLGDDYKKGECLGYLIHSWTGIGGMFFVCLRIIYGLLGPVSIRFSQWVPYNQDRIKLVLEDVKGFAQMRLPDRQPHQGLASLVEAIGLLVFIFGSNGIFVVFYYCARPKRPKV